jgi:Zn-dependent peptidase ImmA (M78 family)
MIKKVPYLSEKQIEHDAATLLAEYARARGVAILPPIPIEDIIEKHLKLGIEFDDTHRLFGLPRSGHDPDILGAMFFDERRIVLDESLDPEENPAKEGRYRYTLAHEGGGHWRLHRYLFSSASGQPALFAAPAPAAVVCRSSQAKERVEWQADFYASCLLMPRKLVFAGWDEMFSDRKQRVLQPRTPINHPFVEVPLPNAGFATSMSPTTMCWTASPGRWPSASSFRRLPCASVWRNSACCFAKFRTSRFSWAAHSFF